MVGKAGRTYETAVEASSLFDAADRALRQWAENCDMNQWVYTICLKSLGYLH
jgi:hypothetical protein